MNSKQWETEIKAGHLSLLSLSITTTFPFIISIVNLHEVKLVGWHAVHICVHAHKHTCFCFVFFLFLLLNFLTNHKQQWYIICINNCCSFCSLIFSFFLSLSELFWHLSSTGAILLWEQFLISPDWGYLGSLFIYLVSAFVMVFQWPLFNK